MAIAWFICPYIRKDKHYRVFRYCAMDDFTGIIRADGGDWLETEVLGNHAIVKVRANADTLTTINAATGFIRLPKVLLTESLSDLTAQQKTAIKNKILELGYPLAEIVETLGDDIGSHTLGDVLRFVAKRRLKPRYDANTDTIIIDGPEQPVTPLEFVDNGVT